MTNENGEPNGEPTNFQEMMEALGIEVIPIVADTPEEVVDFLSMILGYETTTPGESIAHMCGELYSHGALTGAQEYAVMMRLHSLAKHIMVEHVGDEKYDEFRAMFPNPLIFLRGMIHALEGTCLYLDGIRDPEEANDSARRENLASATKKLLELRLELKQATCDHKSIVRSTVEAERKVGETALCRDCSSRVTYQGSDLGWVSVVTPDAI